MKHMYHNNITSVKYMCGLEVNTTGTCKRPLSVGEHSVVFLSYHTGR
jgi:hypothetical protein